MKAQLTKYVDLLFAGAPYASDIKQEILQNTLDRYDDLIAQGKTPQAAYSLAIAGIGDINEILSDMPEEAPAPAAPAHREPAPEPLWRKVLTAIAIFMYIISPIPLFVLSEIGLDTIGLSGTLGVAAVATALIIIASVGKKESREKHEEKTDMPPEQELRKAIHSIIWAVGLCLYFILSFATGAWFVTWLIFVIIPAVDGLVRAILDLKEEK